MDVDQEYKSAARRSVLLLTVLGALSQLLGFGYRVALSRMVGAEVMGLYQLVMPAFSGAVVPDRSGTDGGGIQSHLPVSGLGKQPGCSTDREFLSAVAHAADLGRWERRSLCSAIPFPSISWVMPEPSWG